MDEAGEKKERCRSGDNFLRERKRRKREAESEPRRRAEKAEGGGKHRNFKMSSFACAANCCSRTKDPWKVAANCLRGVIGRLKKKLEFFRGEALIDDLFGSAEFF